MHYSVSTMLAADGYTIASASTERPSWRALWGSAFALSFGLAKEAHDEAIGRVWSWRDVTWDVLGTATGTTVAWLIDRYLLMSPRSTK